MPSRRVHLFCLLGLALALASAFRSPGAIPAAGADRFPPDARTEAVLLGHSRALRVAVVGTGATLELPDEIAALQGTGARFRWTPLFETPGPRVLGSIAATPVLDAPEQPGIWLLETERPDLDGPTDAFTVITRVPFAAKRGGMLNGYHIGRYPTEGSGRTDAYAPPAGFIEVTQASQDLRVSEHFRLRDFLTRDQADVWPKYLVLDLRLVDKLELVIQELNAMGVRAERMHVVSGYRTPQFNGPGGNGRAALSRHMYGDAADVAVDNDGDGWMDDLNGDGRIDLDDADLIQRAVERVERRYPDLVGGSGTYTGMGPRGPYIHIDVRGVRTRW